MRQPFELDVLAHADHRSPPASASRSATATPRASCCATPTWRSTRPRPPARTATRSSSPRWKPRLRRNLGIELDLRSALGNDEFRLVYQPIYNLDDLTLVGVEALLRWDHPTLGVDRARRVHPAARVERPDPRGRPLGARHGLPADGGPGTPSAARSASRSTSRPASSTTTRSSTTSARALEHQRTRPRARSRSRSPRPR